MDSKPKHTPGPWEVAVHGPYNVSIDAADGSVTVAVLDCDTDDREAKAALARDARLIAAAPELVEALRVVASLLDGIMPAGDELDEPIENAMRMARAALAKAGVR
jgi:hypothetical protein